jgi:hypothetical protein
MLLAAPLPLSSLERHVNGWYLQYNVPQSMSSHSRKTDHMRRPYLRRGIVLSVLIVLFVLTNLLNGRLGPNVYYEYLIGIRSSQEVLGVKGTDNSSAYYHAAFKGGAIETNSQHEYNPICWINVKTFAEGIGGWRTSLAELLRLARLVNCTVVEPCMSGGRLGSCLLNRGIPVGEVFDLSEAKFLSGHRRSPILAPYNDYARRGVVVSNNTEYNICMSKLSQSRCPNSTLLPADVNTKRFRKILSSAGRRSDSVVMHLEDLWHSDSKLPKLFGVDVKRIKIDELSFHLSHVQMVEKILGRSNITEDNFSIVHWRAEKKGMDYMECANAVLNAKRAIEYTTSGAKHAFILLTSLNRNASNMWEGSKNMAKNNGDMVVQALDLLRNRGFLKFDELMTLQGETTKIDNGMLAVYELILAMKSRGFASCARDAVCSDVEAAACERCNHVGKFGKLAISLRKSSPVHGRNSSWGCWPQYHGGDKNE